MIIFRNRPINQERPSDVYSFCDLTRKEVSYRDALHLKKCKLQLILTLIQLQSKRQTNEVSRLGKLKKSFFFGIKTTVFSLYAEHPHSPSFPSLFPSCPIQFYVTHLLYLQALLALYKQKFSFAHFLSGLCFSLYTYIAW